MKAMISICYDWDVLKTSLYDPGLANHETLETGSWFFEEAHGQVLAAVTHLPVVSQSRPEFFQKQVPRGEFERS